MTPAEIRQAVATKLGFSLHTGPAGWPDQLRRSDGRSLFFVGNRFDINPHRAVLVARSKALSGYHLLRLGYPVPAARAFRPGDRAAAEQYVRQLGLPVVLKPDTGTNGEGVCVARDAEELARALDHLIGDSSRRALVQEMVEGTDYRLVAVDGEILAAYARQPLAIVGDGRRPVMMLLRDHLDALRSRGRRIQLSADDPRIDSRLRALGLTRESVPASGQGIQLLENANLSTGGEAVDMTDAVHAAYRRLVARLARDSGLRFCGIDLMSARPLDQAPGAYWILELNAAPSLDHFCALGAAQARRVEAVYTRLFAALARI